jgi:hypothetical protein
MEGSAAKPKLDPIDDALYLACKKYIGLLSGGAPEQKNRQWAIIVELFDDRLEHGDDFPLPSEKDLPSEQLDESDTITEGQSIQLAASIMRTLELRQKRGYHG